MSAALTALAVPILVIIGAALALWVIWLMRLPAKQVAVAVVLFVAAMVLCSHFGLINAPQE
jgi:hypothetical protein